MGDLSKKNFYRGDKQAQKEAISKHGILIEKLYCGDDERLNNGLTYLIKTTKTYRDLVSFFKQGGLNPWGEDNRDVIMILTSYRTIPSTKRKKVI